MTSVKVIYKDKKISEVIISGHTGYSVSGSDIVCASISSIVICTVNLLLRYDDECITHNEKDGFVNVVVLKHDEIVDIALLNMIDMLKELKTQYKKNIKIIEEV